MLEAEELVISTPNRGTVVRRVSAREIQETYEVRAVLEGYGAGLAASRMADRKLGHLRRLNRDMKKALGRSYGAEDERVSKLAELNAEFHRTIASLSGNYVLYRTVGSLIETPLYARAYFWYADRLKASSIGDHDRMIELLKSGDPVSCEEFWRGHLYRGRDYLIDYLEAEGERD